MRWTGDSGARISVLPYSLGVQLGLDWHAQRAPLALGGAFASVPAYGIIVEATIGRLSTVRLGFAWADSDEIPILLGHFNFFREFEVHFVRAQKYFEIIRQ